MIIEPLKIIFLLDEISRDHIRLPEIQRKYVWKDRQVRRLLDSLYHEFPIGQILLWDTDELPTTKNIKGIDKEGIFPSIDKPKIVLDGQQRLRSLYRALSKEKDPKIDIWFNLDTEKFQKYSNKFKCNPKWVSVRDIINKETHILTIIKKIKESNICEMNDEREKQYADRIEKLKKIGDYNIPIEVFKSDSYDDATELFVRINSQGTRLKNAELVMAQLALRLPKMIIDTFEKSMEKYKNNGFNLDTRFLTRALIAIGTGQSRFKHLTEFWNKSESEISKIWRDTEKAVDNAVNFVRHNSRIEKSSRLPSLNALITLSAYFNKYPKIAKEVESGLLRWFYLAQLRGRYSGSSESNMDEDLKAIKSNTPLENLMKNLKNMGRPFEVTVDEFDNAQKKNPLFCMIYAVAKKNHAKDWFTGVELTSDVIGKDNSIQDHHIFPQKILRENGIDRKDRDEIANLAFLGANPNRRISASLPEKYLNEIAKSHPERLESQCIPMDKSLWKIENFQKFLEKRRQLLAEAVNKLLKCDEPKQSLLTG